MPSLSRRQPSLNLRKSAFEGNAASSTRSSFESTDSALDRFWAVQAASSEDMDFPVRKLSSLPSRQKKSSNNLGLSIKAELHDVYQSSEEETSPNPEEVDWTSSTDDDDVDEREAPETSEPQHCAEPMTSLDGTCEVETSDLESFYDEPYHYHTAYAVRLPITTWDKPRLIDIPAPTLRLKRSKAINRKSAGSPSARPVRPIRKQSLVAHAVADVPALDPDTDDSKQASSPSSTYSEDFGSDQPVTPLTSIHPSMVPPPQQLSSPTGYTSLLPPLVVDDAPATSSIARKPSPKPYVSRAKAAQLAALPPPTPTLRKKESSTWKSVTTTITRARKATVSGLTSPSQDVGYYMPSIPRSKTGSDLTLARNSTPSPLLARNSTPSSLAHESKKPKMRMVARGAAERQDAAVLDFLLEG